MKKKYVSPEINLIEMETVNLMALSSVNEGSYDGGNSNNGINEGIGTWNDSEEGEY